MAGSRDGRDNNRRGRSRSRSREGRYDSERNQRPTDDRDRRARRSSRSQSPSRPSHRSRHSRSRSPKRRRSISRDKDKNEKDKRKRGRTRSRSVSSGAGSSRSTSPDHRHHKRKKDKHSKRSSRSRERKERKKEKKEKKKKHASSTAVPQWGKYGILTESDLFTKGPEFYAWLIEERKINPETISKDQNRKEFLRFIEDFNTATLPDVKYYDMASYERRMSALRQGEFVPPPDDSYDPMADMKDHQGAHKKKVVEHDSYLNKDQLMALRKVQHERIEAGKMKLLGMDVKHNMGVRMDGTMFDG